MRTFVEGVRPVVAGRALSLDADDRVLVDGRMPRAGDGVAAALAATVVDGLRADASERAIAVDQTNTSLIVDDRVVVKLVGRWAAADRAGDLLSRLTAAGSTEIARLHGLVGWRHPSRGSTVLAVVTEYLPDAEDGWTWAVADVLAHLAGGPEPEWPAVLGAQVARLHEVLGTDARPAPAGTPALRAAQAERALEAAAPESAVDAASRPDEATSTRPLAADGRAGADQGRESSRRRLLNRRAALVRDIRSLADAAPGLVFPIHGDLHVGQILASDDGHGAARRYTIIDFDGDPQLDPADRDRPDAAGRDVGHLLVSFDLVAAVVQKRLQRADPAAWSWADRARTAFLDAYRATLARGELFDDALLPGFEAEQLLAELAYADRFLPRWRYAPDAAIAHRHPAPDAVAEPPWTPPPLDSLEHQ